MCVRIGRTRLVVALLLGLWACAEAIGRRGEDAGAVNPTATGNVTAASNLTATDILTAGRADDVDSDSAAFLVTVLHNDGWACSGALVADRAALTVASCARVRPGLDGSATALWAWNAGAVVGVARTNVAAGGAVAGGEGLALLELTAAFPAATGARPILMATTMSECSPPAKCYLVRTLPRAALAAVSPAAVSPEAPGVPPAGPAALRILPAELVSARVCQRRAESLQLRDGELCLTGPKLCQSDIGTGVVSGGKLCGVLARSAAAGDSGGGGGGARDGGGCGDTHAALALAHWRDFLHCAHILNYCGLGECSLVCSTRELWPPRAATRARTPPPMPPAPHTAAPPRTTAREPQPSPPPPSLPPPSSTPPAPHRTEAATVLEPRPAPPAWEFKAGDYDVASEYGGSDELPRPATRTTSPPTLTPTTSASTPGNITLRALDAAVPLDSSRAHSMETSIALMLAVAIAIHIVTMP